MLKEKIEYQDYEIKEYERLISEIDDLKNKIDNPSKGRLLNLHLYLQKQLKDLVGTGIEIEAYKKAKKIIEAGYKLVRIKNNDVGYVSDETLDGSRVMYHGVSSYPTPCHTGAYKKEITPAEYMNAIMTRFKKEVLSESKRL
jgi:hypothetical protein